MFLNRLSAAEQAAAHLREELSRGRWSGTMPGQAKLAKELGVSRVTAEAALRQLETEGLLIGQGPGRSRLIPDSGKDNSKPLRVALLLHERNNEQNSYMVELRHALEEAGHTTLTANETLTDMMMDLQKVARLVKKTAADAWIVCAASRNVLEWFSQQPIASFALFGRRSSLPMPGTGPNKPPAIASITRHLIDLGHKRIVLLCRSLRRLPEPGTSEKAFLNELANHGLSAGTFNLPDWTETREGFQNVLDSLFRVTPPTALIIDEAPFVVATMQFLISRNLRIPEDVSIVGTDADPAFEWCEPQIAHIRWDAQPVVRRIVNWTKGVSRGKRDMRQTAVPAEFFVGGTTGPAPVE